LLTITQVRNFIQIFKVNETMKKTMRALSSVMMVSAALTVSADTDFDPKTPEPIINIIQKSPNAIPLDKRDESRDVTKLFRNCNCNKDECKNEKPEHCP
jgi:hypothetical protein